jgi:glutathione S-transferase
VILYDSIGPNPRVVRMFAAEKLIELEYRRIDVVAGENRRPEYLAKNPHGTTPLLELADGTHIGETVAICEYLDEVSGAPSLLGASPADRARVRMWTRRIDLNFCAPLVTAFRGSEGRAMFEPRMPVVGETAARELKAIACAYQAQLEARLTQSANIAGEHFTLADIVLFCFVEFGARVAQPVLPEMTHLQRWRDAVRTRPSAAC